MKIFVDTNIVSEFLEDRAQADLVEQIFIAAEQNRWERVLSVGSFYTITFLTERFLRHKGIGQPELVANQRMILQQLLAAFTVEDLDAASLSEAVLNPAFMDLEDSYQYECALKSGCDVLLTINKKDFKNATADSLSVLTPEEFINDYLSI